MKTRSWKIKTIVIAFLCLSILGLSYYFKVFLPSKELAAEKLAKENKIHEYENFFESANANLLSAFNKTNILFIQGTTMNNKIKTMGNTIRALASQEFSDTIESMAKYAKERLERSKLALAYAKALYQGNDPKLKELHTYLKSTFYYTLKSAEGEWIRVNRLDCSISVIRGEKSTNDCATTVEEDDKIAFYGQQFELANEEYRKFIDLAATESIQVGCLKCAAILTNNQEEIDQSVSIIKSQLSK